MAWVVSLVWLAFWPNLAAISIATLVKARLHSWYRFAAAFGSRSQVKALGHLWKPGGKLPRTCPSGALPTCPKWEMDFSDFTHGMTPSCPAKDPNLGHGSLLAGAVFWKHDHSCLHSKPSSREFGWDHPTAFVTGHLICCLFLGLE